MLHVVIAECLLHVAFGIGLTVHRTHSLMVSFLLFSLLVELQHQMPCWKPL